MSAAVLWAEPDADHAAELRGIRHSLGLNQAAFAARLGVRQCTVSRWETGELEIGTRTLLAAREQGRAA